MELNEVIKKRASVRRFRDKKVDMEDIKKLITAAGAAPSVANSQPWKFFVVTNADKIKKVGEIAREKISNVYPDDHEKSKQVKMQVEKFATFFIDAPVLIIATQKPYEAVVDKILLNGKITHDEVNRMRNFPNFQTMGGAVENLMLTAVDMELGACWLTGTNVASKEIEEYLQIPSPYEMVAAIAVGYPDGVTFPREKKPIEEIMEVID